MPAMTISAPKTDQPSTSRPFCSVNWRMWRWQ